MSTSTHVRKLYLSVGICFTALLLGAGTVTDPRATLAAATTAIALALAGAPRTAAALFGVVAFLTISSLDVDHPTRPRSSAANSAAAAR